MKRTRFFYRKINTLLLLLAWSLLLGGAYRMNRGRQEERQETAGKEGKTDAEADAERRTTGMKAERGESGTEECENPDIRVLLMNTDEQSYYHSDVSFICRGVEYVYNKDAASMKDDETCTFSADENGITVTSLVRAQGHPTYEGKLEIIKKQEGFLLINTLPMESYLEGVVPSEMPSAYHPEALKAQAVCARTYAWKQAEEGRLAEYGADVDDSVNFQVYNNIEKQESTSKAVRETKGQVLCQNGELIEAYYFSTSSGATSTDEIWGADKAAPYLKSVSCMFDFEEPWSRWEVNIPWEKVENQAQTLWGCGGGLVDLEVVKKNQSGAVTGLFVHTEEGSLLLENEYEIRAFLSPEGIPVTEKNGEEVSGGKLLPSAYFTMETEPGENVFIRGGGYGHGVGMSQTAANHMAEEGYGWEDILKYFFRDIEIEKITKS